MTSENTTPEVEPGQDQAAIEEPAITTKKKMPYGHRFLKGGPSPNPFGRPRKLLPSALAALDPNAARMLQFDRKLTGILKDGEEVTYGDAVIMQLHSLAVNGDKKVADKAIKAMGLYLAHVSRAAELERTKKEKSVIGALEYIARFTAQFDEAEQLGRKLPKVFPDPRDIRFSFDGTVTIDGPINARERRLNDVLVKGRDAMLELLEHVAHSDRLAEDEAKEFWLMCRRKLYSIHRKLPRRLRRSIPSFPKNAPRMTEEKARKWILENPSEFAALRNAAFASYPDAS